MSQLSCLLQCFLNHGCWRRRFLWNHTMLSENVIPSPVSLQVPSVLDEFLLPFCVLVWVHLDLNRYIRHVIHRDRNQGFFLKQYEMNRESPSDFTRFVATYVVGGMSKCISLRPKSCTATCGCQIHFNCGLGVNPEQGLGTSPYNRQLNT